ncbi:hypothetical protein AVEN_103192-1 [Araneus ventricosus]|uniref:Uncharacterized protein n=1 Tax=Araneus ventricosus TaxID=182803 RepID=A0A4Y2FUM5_ARAVE|nr:hypothetical protein AVEN_103192-1 [Araneus ventricosus]
MMIIYIIDLDVNVYIVELNSHVPSHLSFAVKKGPNSAKEDLYEVLSQRLRGIVVILFDRALAEILLQRCRTDLHPFGKIMSGRLKAECCDVHGLV